MNSETERIRPATPADAAMLTDFSLRSKAVWSYPPDWMEAFRPELTLTAERLATIPAFVLEADGLAESTAIFFWGDHGRGLTRGKRWVYDSGIRVPLLVRWPGQVKPGASANRSADHDTVPVTPVILLVRPRTMGGR